MNEAELTQNSNRNLSVRPSVRQSVSPSVRQGQKRNLSNFGAKIPRTKKNAQSAKIPTPRRSKYVDSVDSIVCNYFWPILSADTTSLDYTKHQLLISTYYDYEFRKQTNMVPSEIWRVQYIIIDLSTKLELLSTMFCVEISTGDIFSPPVACL
jgi:hypothetical protein